MKWRYAHTALLLCTLAFMVTMAARLAISPLVPAVTDDFGISNAAVGLAFSLMWAAYALMQFPSGLLADKFGERKVILASVGLTGLWSLGVVIAPTYAVFVLFMALLGGAAGLHYTPATTYLSKLFDDVGRAIGIHITGSAAAGLFVPIVVTVVATRYGWRAGALLGLVMAVPIFVLFAWRVRPTVPDRPDQPMGERMEPSVILGQLTRPPIAFTTVISFLCAFTWQGTAAFLPAFFLEGHGLSPTLASALFSVYFLVHGLTQPVTGWMSDRYGRDPTTALAMSVGIVGYAVLVLGDAVGWYVLGVCLAGFAMSWGAPLQSRFMDLFATADRGAGFGLVRTVYITTGATGSFAVGATADLFGWSVSFGFLVVILALVLGALLVNRALGLGL